MTDLQVDDAEVTRQALQRRTLRVLIVAQVLGGAGLAAGVTVGALLAEDLLGSTSSAGCLPRCSPLRRRGAAGRASVPPRWTPDRPDRRLRRRGRGCRQDRRGRRRGNVALLLVALVVYGAGTATNLQARYAGADLAEPTHRGRAVSTVLVATTVGAMAGPNLVAVTGRLADAAGIPSLAGPFVLAGLAYALAAAVLYVFLRPDPLLVARARQLDAPQNADPSPAGQAHDPAPGRAQGSVRLAATAMVLTQTVMVAIMTMTPVHLRDHGLGAVGAVIATHIAFMYLPSRSPVNSPTGSADAPSWPPAAPCCSPPASSQRPRRRTPSGCWPSP